MKQVSIVFFLPIIDFVKSKKEQKSSDIFSSSSVYRTVVIVNLIYQIYLECLSTVVFENNILIDSNLTRIDMPRRRNMHLGQVQDKKSLTHQCITFSVPLYQAHGMMLIANSSVCGQSVPWPQPQTPIMALTTLST